MEDQILEEFRKILKDVSDGRVQETLEYVAKCLNPDAPSYEISLEDFQYGILALLYSVDNQYKDRFNKLVDQVTKILFERGYRVNYSTYQEHILMGSSQWIGYANEPHKPIGVIKKELTVEEANKARGLIRKQSAFGEYFCIDSMFVQISLEPLDENGNTIRDPRLLDDNLNPVETKYSSDFPFKRTLAH